MTLYNLRKVAIEVAADAVLDHWAATGRIGPTLADRSTHSGDAIDVATVCIDRADRALRDLAQPDDPAAILAGRLPADPTDHGPVAVPSDALRALLAKTGLNAPQPNPAPSLPPTPSEPLHGPHSPESGGDSGELE